MPEQGGNIADAQSAEVVAAVLAWIATELPVALSRSVKLQIEIHINEHNITPSLRLFYNLTEKHEN